MRKTKKIAKTIKNNILIANLKMIRKKVRIKHLEKAALILEFRRKAWN